jgi:uncharacterized membrane protein YhaH (DUF805 family)
MKKHSKQYYKSNHLGGYRRRRRFWGWAIAILVISFAVWLIYTIDMANARAATGYGIAVRNCISIARELNQYATVHLDPQSCVNNPNYIK